MLDPKDTGHLFMHVGQRPSKLRGEDRDSSQRPRKLRGGPPRGPSKPAWSSKSISAYSRLFVIFLISCWFLGAYEGQFGHKRPLKRCQTCAWSRQRAKKAPDLERGRPRRANRALQTRPTQPIDANWKAQGGPWTRLGGTRRLTGRAKIQK